MNMTTGNLEKLLDDGALWRGRQGGAQAGSVEPSGWSLLDDACGGGWPGAGLTEILSAGHQGLPLLLPLLARLSEQPRWLAWIAPPWLPYAPALAAQGISMQRLLLVQDIPPQQHLWAAEQAMKSGSCSVVMLWPERLQTAQVRRLQLAAEQGDCIGVLFRSLRDSGQSSPAALRLRLGPSPLGLDVEVLKRRGGWAGGCCTIRL